MDMRHALRRAGGGGWRGFAHARRCAGRV